MGLRYYKKTKIFSLINRDRVHLQLALFVCSSNIDHSDVSLLMFFVFPRFIFTHRLANKKICHRIIKLNRVASHGSIVSYTDYLLNKKILHHTVKLNYLLAIHFSVLLTIYLTWKIWRHTITYKHLLIVIHLFTKREINQLVNGLPSFITKNNSTWNKSLSERKIT